MSFGLDYATPVTGAAALRAFKKAGVTFVCRYISTPGNPKNLTSSEVAALKTAGISLVIVFETTANRALSGYQGGNHDAVSATTQVNALGLRGIPIYFAVDFDETSSDFTAVGNYFRGAVAALGHDRVGVYGGLRAVTHILDDGICKWAWQTYAWSGGQWDSRGHIQQYSNGQRVAGVSCDYDRNIKPDYGQWPRPKAPTAVTKYGPPWPIFGLTGQIANGKLVTKEVVQRIVAALRAAGKTPPWTATLEDGTFVAKGQFWHPRPGIFTFKIARQLRAGRNVVIDKTVTIRTRRV